MSSVQFEVLITKSAENELLEIYEYISSNRSPEIADKFLDEVLEKVSSLKYFPERGNITKELEKLGIKNYRQLVLFPYRIIYQQLSDKIYVMAITDGRRDIRALLERRLLLGDW